MAPAPQVRLNAQDWPLVVIVAACLLVALSAAWSGTDCIELEHDGAAGATFEVYP